MTKKSILVTGGAGFVGSHLVDALLKVGHDVRVFDSLTPQVHPRGRPDYLDPNVEFLQGDMRNSDEVKAAISGVDIIFHQAAAVGVAQSMYEIERYMGVNTQGTAVLLQALLERKMPIEKLIVASSMSIYGEGQYACMNCGTVVPPPRATSRLKEKRWDPACPRCELDLTPVPTGEDKPLQATSIYALSKKDQEEMCLLFGKTFEVPVVALRYFNIYGTRQALSNPYTGVAAIFASRLLNDRVPMIFEDGEQLRDFVSVYDVVQANMLAIETNKADGRALNIGSGQPISIRRVADTLTLSLEKSIQSDITGKYRAGDIRHCFADISEAKALLGFEPKHSFKSGVEDLVAWLQSQQAEDYSTEMMQQLKAYGLSA